jgi:hypothetical protein
MATNDNDIAVEVRRNLAEEIEVVALGPDKYGIVTPMAFDDGDLLPLVLRKDDAGWYLTDEGHTFLQLTYELEEADFRQPTRREIVNKNLSMFGMENRGGELVLRVEENKFGDALYTFAQALVKIDDIRYLSRERARSTFIEDVHQMVREVASPERDVIYNWHHPDIDPTGNYPVDCKINGTGKPVFVFALPNDSRVALATVSLLRLKQEQLDFKSVGIFEDQTKLDPKWVARFTDVADKPFSNLETARKDILKYVPELGRLSEVGQS